MNYRPSRDQLRQPVVETVVFGSSPDNHTDGERVSKRWVMDECTRFAVNGICLCGVNTVDTELVAILV